ncbi:MAG: DUF1800 domain-containing protein [Acidobacteria bacterium]|nr:DUF1800 domain-containing protein [Acidobacteriota bacterium]
MRNRYSIQHRSFAILMALSLIFPIFAAGNTPVSTAKPLTDEQKIMHVLNRLGFGARSGDVEKVKAVGLRKYIEQQLDPASIPDTVAESKVKGLDVFGMSTAELFAKYPNPGALLRQIEGANNTQARTNQPNTQAQADPADMTDADRKERRQKIAALYEEYDLKPAAQIVPQIAANRVLRAVYSERQLQEAMVDFWQNHFNVFAGKAAVRWYIPSYERDVLRPNALGNFKDLLIGTAQHPAMLFFLDNFESVAPNAQAGGNNANAQRIQRLIQSGGQLPPQARERLKQQYRVNDAQLDQRLKEMRTAPQPAQQGRKRGINENYARELMELHTLGVDNGYTQQDIIEVAKCLTGWTIADPRGYRRAAASMIQGTEDKRLGRLQRLQGVPEDVESGEFYFNSRAHVTGPKTVMGQKIDEGGIKDGLKVMDILANSPATAKFIARKLAVKFVNDNPNDAYVSRIADAFHRSGGDIKATLKAMFSDKEFFATENYRAKIKTPFELAVSSIRTLGADTNASPALLAMLNKPGEVPYGYQAPTGYPDTAEDWVNTGALLERLNFAVAIASNRIPGTRVDLNAYASKGKAKILDQAIESILDGDVSAATRANLLKQLEQPLPEVKAGKELTDNAMAVPNMRDGQEGGRQNRQARLLNPSGDPEVFKAISLVLGTPEFQRQ